MSDGQRLEEAIIKIWKSISSDVHNCRLFMLYYKLYTSLSSQVAFTFEEGTLNSENDFQDLAEEMKKSINENISTAWDEDENEFKNLATIVDTFVTHITYMIHITWNDVKNQIQEILKEKEGVYVQFTKIHSLFPVRFNNHTKSPILRQAMNIGKNFNHNEFFGYFNIISATNNEFINVDFEHVNLNGANFKNITLENCVFHGEQIKELSQSMTGATLINCTLVFDKIPHEIIEGCLIECLEYKNDGGDEVFASLPPTPRSRGSPLGSRVANSTATKSQFFHTAELPDDTELLNVE